MATFNTSLTRMRRFLRDTGAVIWTSERIRQWFNEAQIEVAQKTGLLEAVESHPYPQPESASYTYGWEAGNVSGRSRKFTTTWQASSAEITYAWETDHYVSDGVSEVGTTFSHPFEASLSAPSDVLSAVLDGEAYRLKLVAFDQDVLASTVRSELADADQFYRTRSGEAVSFWRPDEYGNEVVLYPRPSALSTDADASVYGDGVLTTIPLNGSSTTVGTDGCVCVIGTSVSSINDEDLLVIYERTPADVPSTTANWDDDLDWPEWVVHYIEAATLERAFGADTDGYAPSLRDYWKLRKEIGLGVVKSYRVGRMKDMHLRLGGTRNVVKSRFSLGERYPATWP